MKMIHVNRQKQASLARRQRRAVALAATLATVILGGCTALTQPIDGVPANRLPDQFFAPPKNNLVAVDISLLSIEPPREYQVDKGDILGVYIEGVLPFNPPNATPEPPPVNFPDQNSLLPPSLGFPIAIQEDGTLSLPLIAPVDVRGLTLDQVRDRIRDAYIQEDILRPEKARPIVSLIKERTYNVIVVRQDGGGPQGRGGGLQNQSLIAGAIRGTSDYSGAASLVKLPAYQNDILHALVETGGLPGLQARNEVKILRAKDADRRKRAEFMVAFNAQQRAAMLDPCACPPSIPDDPSILRIPLRLPPGQLPDITPDDVVLEDGDIVFIEARETEVFYTGGLLPGGEFQLPRDYDLDVIGAIAIAGGNVGGAQVGPGFGAAALFGGRGGMVVPPGMLYILRKTPCNGQVAIEVNLTKAINDPRQRPLVQPGDILILQYSCEEDLLNAGASAFSTFGVAEILRQSR
jgi:hypothetical protein